MILSEKGKYFFDPEKKTEYTRSFHKNIVSNLFGFPGQNPFKVSYSETIKNIEFNFENCLQNIQVTSTLNSNGNTLIKYPINLSIVIEDGQNETIDIFSLEQFEKILKLYHIEYPIVNSVILTEEMKKNIFENNTELNLEIMNIPLNEIYNEQKEKDTVFGILSKYAHLYIKSEFDMKDFPEKEFFNIKDFSIENKDKMDYYYSSDDERAQIWDKLYRTIKKDTFYFLTGPHGIGKTFTLLGFLWHVRSFPYIHYIYINLDILSREKNFIQIIFYEAINLFDSIEEYKSAFKYVQNNLKFGDLIYSLMDTFNYLNRQILSTVICLIEYIDSNKSNKESKDKYVIIIDQFKYINDLDKNSDLIIKLKGIIEKKKSFSLIVCSSLNYYGIKNSLIMRLSNRENECKFIFDYYKKLLSKPKINDSNKYLSLLGYLPRYCQIQKLINKKYINLMKKIIKRKFLKFYSNNNNSSFEIEDVMAIKLKWIKEKKKYKLTNDEFLEFIKYHPIKYFIIDFGNFSFDYLFPLIGIIIDEIIDSKELKDSSKGLLNEAQRGWYFEHLFFNTIKNKNVFLNYYIENIILIKTIFKKQKIENFDKKANTLFCFTISNVQRYDGLIYIAEIGYAIFLQVSINKTKKKLEEYTDETLIDDIKKINKKFFKTNGIIPKKYYLIFIFDYDNYMGNANNYNMLKQFDYNFRFYHPQKDELNSAKFSELKEIPFKSDNLIEENEEEENNLGYFFVKNQHFELKKEEEIEYKPGYYYIEKGMNLLTFLEETCSEYNELINDIDKIEYMKYQLINFNKEYYMNQFDLNDNSNHIIYIALNENDLIFGKSFRKKGENKNDCEWFKWSNEIFKHEIKKLDDKEVKHLYRIKGFFVFQKIISIGEMFKNYN